MGGSIGQRDPFQNVNVYISFKTEFNIYTISENLLDIESASPKATINESRLPPIASSFYDTTLSPGGYIILQYIERT